MGHEYLKMDPLNEAKKYVQMLTKYAPQSISTWILQYDVSIRRQKYLMALQALCQARKIDPYHAEVFTRTVDFVKNVDQYCNTKNINNITNNNTASVVRAVITQEVPVLLNHATSLDEYIIQAQHRIRDDPFIDVPFRIAVVKASLESTTTTTTSTITGRTTIPIPEVVQYLIDYGGIHTSRQVSYDHCRTALELLQRLGPDASDAVQHWEEEMSLRYPTIVHGVAPMNDDTKGQRNIVVTVE